MNYEDLKQENERLKQLLADKEDVNREYKDRLFKFIFGNSENKQWTLSLYNAMNGTSYTDPEDIRFNTLSDAVYMRMKNDVSFIVSSDMNLWEHQSSYNPNMPMRFLIYAGRLYEKYIKSSDYHPYSSKLQHVPRPICICFYNGKEDQPDTKVPKLSDAYEGVGSIEVEVTMVNINYGKNKDLMDACKPLKEYAWLVDTVRTHQDEKMSLENAVDTALNEMPDEFAIKTFLLENRAEVKSMFLTEYDEEKTLRLEREEGRDEGREEGDLMARERVALNMLRESGPAVPVSFIAKMTGFSEDEVMDLARENGIALA